MKTKPPGPAGRTGRRVPRAGWRVVPETSMGGSMDERDRLPSTPIRWKLRRTRHVTESASKPMQEKSRFAKAPPAMGAVLAAALLATLAGPRPADAQDHFESMDVFALEYAADPQISPDGRQVVYARTSMDVMRDRRRSELWIVNVDGSGHRRLGEGGSPRWSPDGTRLAYTAGGQIHLRWMDTGETATLTQLVESPGGIRWSPDGRHIAFNMLVPYPRRAWWRRRAHPREPIGRTRPSWRIASRTAGRGRLPGLRPQPHLRASCRGRDPRPGDHG